MRRRPSGLRSYATGRGLRRRKKKIRRTISRFLYRRLPGGGSHSSRPAVSSGLEQPTRELKSERAAPPPLFGLAPHGVCPANRIAPAAVRFYRTFSPSPRRRGGIFSVALSVDRALSAAPRPLAGMLPCGDRTFLPLSLVAKLKPVITCRTLLHPQYPTNLKLLPLLCVDNLWKQRLLHSHRQFLRPSLHHASH